MVNLIEEFAKNRIKTTSTIPAIPNQIEVFAKTRKIISPTTTAQPNLIEAFAQGKTLDRTFNPVSMLSDTEEDKKKLTKWQWVGKQLMKPVGTVATEIEALVSKEYHIISGGTDNHMMLIDLRNKNITGKEAENALVKADITVNKNMVPFDDKSPFITSGIRIGSAAITTRGLLEGDMAKIVDLIDEVINNFEDETILEAVAGKVNELMQDKPLFS